MLPGRRGWILLASVSFAIVSNCITIVSPSRSPCRVMNRLGIGIHISLPRFRATATKESGSASLAPGFPAGATESVRGVFQRRRLSARQVPKRRSNVARLILAGGQSKPSRIRTWRDVSSETNSETVCLQPLIKRSDAYAPSVRGTRFMLLHWRVAYIEPRQRSVKVDRSARGGIRTRDLRLRRPELYPD